MSIHLAMLVVQLAGCLAGRVVDARLLFAGDPSHQADARFPARRDVLTRDGCGDSLRLPEGALVSSENLHWGFQSELRVELAH
jgi:hypothetical protein